ncbi:MAG: hypothetical protein JKY54_07120 [Flavobacteriales bacterium]|nr:hypothetical protein [Flavobacteriales bacterium]
MALGHENTEQRAGMLTANLVICILGPEVALKNQGPITARNTMSEVGILGATSLKPVKNFRTTTPRCCVTCKHYKDFKEESDLESSFECERGGATSGDTEDYTKTCDRYKIKEN